MTTPHPTIPDDIAPRPAVASPGLVDVIVAAFAKLAPATQWKTP